jgi:uncharacterized phage-associated protein
MKSVKPPIRFKFDLDKLIAGIGYFASTGIPNLSKLKVCKLLYYADKEHLLKYGRPVIGDVYYHLDNGPVPSKSLDIMNEVINRDKVYLKSGEISNQEKFTQFLKVHKPAWSRHPVFQLKKEPDLGCLSESENEALAVALKKYGALKPGELIDRTHQEAPWRQSSPNSEIDYRLFFVDEPEANPEALAYMESMQENLEIVLGLE